MRQLTVVPLMIWLGALGLLLGVAVAISSCATSAPRTLPACAPYQYRIAEDDNGDRFRVLDEEDVAKLNALILGLAHGTCRLPTTPPPQRSEQPPEPTREGLDT